MATAASLELLRLTTASAAPGAGRRGWAGSQRRPIAGARVLKRCVNVIISAA